MCVEKEPSGSRSKHQLRECGSMHPGTFCKLDNIRLLYDEVMANQNNIGTEDFLWASVKFFFFFFCRKQWEELFVKA